MDKRNAIWAVAAIAVVAILFFLMQPPKPTGLFIGLFAVCPNGVCEADDPYDPYDFGETYLTCPADCKCGNGICDAGETCASCPGDCHPVCDTNADCADSNPLTVNVCNNPATCSASCSVLCTARCADDPGCNDNNSLTVDTCLRPGACNADCNYVPTCSIRCDDNSDCADSNPLTVNVCNNPATCSASCSVLCTARCAVNLDCNDNNALTTDTCLRPGACNADCNYVPTCSIRCDDNSDCSDGLPLTLDVCTNPNTCSSSCSNPACTAACSSDDNCDDNNSLTIDVCRNDGTCSARCSNATCRIDCDSNFDCDDNNSLTADACINAGSCNSRCSRTSCRVACAGDANCNDNNAMTIDACLNPGDCNASCSHSRQQLSIEIQVGFENAVVRGQTVDLTLMVKDDAGNPVDDANVSLTDAEGNTITFDSVGDGYYTGQYNVPSNSPLGTHHFSFSAESDGKVAYQELSLDVTKGNINVILVQPTELSAAVGQEVEVKFRLVYDNNASVQGATAIAVLKGAVISLQFDGTVFAGKHLFGEADAGEAVLVINAADSFGNSGAATFTFNVVPQFPWFLVVLLLLLVIAIAVAFFVLKKKRAEKQPEQQNKWVFKKEED